MKKIYRFKEKAGIQACQYLGSARTQATSKQNATDANW